MDTFTAAFYSLTLAFRALNSADNLYGRAATLYKSHCDLYTLAATAYSKAVHCAMVTALEGNLQEAKNDFEVYLLEGRANNAAATDLVTAKAKAAAFKTKAAANAAAAQQLEQEACAAESKAQAFLARAKAAEVVAAAAIVPTVREGDRVEDKNFSDGDDSREALLADLLDYAIVGAAHLERGLTDFPRWSQAMLSEGDPAIRPFLPSIFENAKRIRQGTHKILPEQD
jgi:hypothetical protein